MDPLSEMLAGLRSEGASAARDALRPPWKTRFDGAPLTMLTIAAGEARLLTAGAEHTLRAGATALVRGPEAFHLAADEDTRYAAGVFRGLRPRHERLLHTLPAVVLHQERTPQDVLWLTGLDDVLARRDAPGGNSLVDRVLDWGLVCTLSCWFEDQGTAAPAWFRGALDPVVGPAITAMHERPAQAWTVEALAAEARVSRAHFAKRFSAVMGLPPLTYLTEHRMSLAEDLLADPDAPVSAVARAVGYADPFAFSSAFKRLQGMSPRDFRAHWETAA